MTTIIHTETSTYILDRKNKQIARLPGTTIALPNLQRDPLPPILNNLRKDLEPLELIELITCEIGKPMEMTLKIRNDGVETYRRTTPVRAIIDEN